MIYSFSCISMPVDKYGNFVDFSPIIDLFLPQHPFSHKHPFICARKMRRLLPPQRREKMKTAITSCMINDILNMLIQYIKNIKCLLNLNVSVVSTSYHGVFRARKSAMRRSTTIP